MRSTLKVTFFIRKDKISSAGRSMIYVRLTIDSQHCQFTTKADVSVKIWDPKNYRATGYSQEAEAINNYLDSIKSKLLEHHRELVKSEDVFTPEDVKDAFMGIAKKKTTLLTTFAEFIERQEQVIGIDISESWFTKYDLTYRRLKEFLKVKRDRDDIPLYSINHDFVMDFHTFLKVDHKLSINSSEKLLRIFKRITTKAFKEGKIKCDPFASYTIKKEKRGRVYLTEDELLKIYHFQSDIPRLQKVRDLFVFACFTGVDYSTMSSLTEDSLEYTDNGIVIKIPRVKTKEMCEIPVLPQALEILEKYKGQDPHGLLLPKISNAKYNEYLKEIGHSTGIKKKLKTHVARHTFATTALKNGVPLEVIQKILGHSKIATTQIYARIVDETVTKEMNILESKLSKKFNKRIA